MKVIGAGFGRTGTMSMQAALEQLGLGPCYHMKEVLKRPSHAAHWRAARRGEPVDWRSFLAGWSSAVDWPACTFYRELLAAFPDARVVLTVREPARWHQSCLDTIYNAGRFPVRHLAALIPKVNEVFRMADEIIWDGTFQGRFTDRAHALAVYEAHIDAVKRHVPPERLLVFDVREGWGPLCRFLGVPEPDAPFPHLNDTAQIQGQFRALRMALVAVPLLVMAGLAWWAWGGWP